jgi:class 3 adenylate cyclase/alpha-beta hydrolase superfamily lysophospholipase
MAEVQYARTDDGVHIAYKVLDAGLHGAGAHDIVMVSGGLFPMESFEGYSGFDRLLEGLREIGRVVVFDRRGVGLSDPPADFDRPILDQWAEDLRAVVDASSAENVVVFAWDGFGVGSRFAARNPECIVKLVLHHPLVAGDDDEWWVRRRDLIRRNLSGEGGEELLATIAPSHVSDPSFREWYVRAGRMGASPASASRIWESVFASTLEEQLLEEIDVPTLVLARGDHIYAPPEAVRAAAARIRRVNSVELRGEDLFPFLGDVDAVVAEVSNFVLGERRTPPPQRLLAAVLFTDLVDSTVRAAALGDARWKTLLDRHDAVMRAAVGHCGGTVVKGTGDGVLALLPSASAALQVAARARRELAAEQLDTRIGIHVGDIDRRGDDISGLAVHIAARVMAKAGTSEIFVTESVVAATGGPGPQFEHLGTHDLKGVPGTWTLYRHEPTS